MVTAILAACAEGCALFLKRSLMPPGMVAYCKQGFAFQGDGCMVTATLTPCAQGCALFLGGSPTATLGPRGEALALLVQCLQAETLGGHEEDAFSSKCIKTLLRWPQMAECVCLYNAAQSLSVQHLQGATHVVLITVPQEVDGNTQASKVELLGSPIQSLQGSRSHRVLISSRQVQAVTCNSVAVGFSSMPGGLHCCWVQTNVEQVADGHSCHCGILLG